MTAIPPLNFNLCKIFFLSLNFHAKNTEFAAEYPRSILGVFGSSLEAQLKF